MALQNTDYFLVNRGGTGYRLSWSELQTTTEASLQIQDVFTYTGTTGATTGAQTDVPLDIDQGIRLPVAGTGDYNVDGAIRYSPSNSKLEMYYAGAWNTASGGTAFGSTPPSPATEGDVWFDTDNGRSYVYYNDGSSSQWVEMNPSWNNGVPPDTIDTVELKDGSVTPAKLSGGALDYNATSVGIGDIASAFPLRVRHTNSDDLNGVISAAQSVGDGSSEQTTTLQLKPTEGKTRLFINNTDAAVNESFHIDIGDTGNALVIDNDGDLSVTGNISISEDKSIDFTNGATLGKKSDNWIRWDMGATQGVVIEDNGSSTMVLEDGGVFRPANSNTGSIGSSSAYWNNGYFTGLTVASELNVRGAIDLADNDVIRLGSGDDAELFCNGSHLYLDLNSGIGNFYIRDGSTTRYTFDDNGTLTCGTVSANLVTSKVGSATAGLTAGTVGSYNLLQYDGSQQAFTPNATLSGSVLRYTNCGGNRYTGGRPGGSYRLMGRLGQDSSLSDPERASVFLRYA